MSYQIIYTTRAQDSGMLSTNAAAVVRTRGMSAELERCVAERTLRIARTAAAEPTFYYMTAPDGGELFHVLVSARSGQDGSCTIHHLILRESECRKLVQTDNCATPAGVILMQELQRFWVKEWHGQSTILDEVEARFPGTCPSPHMRAMWQVLTGGSESAGLLQQAPYCDGCVVSLPIGMRARDMLSVLHESDAQRKDRGWGMGFCVPTSELRLPEGKERLVCVADSSLEQWAHEASVPVLELRPGMKAPSSPDVPKPERISSPPPSESPKPAAKISPLAALPVMMSCRHAEYSSEDLFEMNPGDELPRRSRLLPIVIGSAVVLCGAAILPGLLNGEKSEPHHVASPSMHDRTVSPNPASDDNFSHPPVRHKRLHIDGPSSQSR